MSDGIKRDGFGTAGYCMLCSLEDVELQDDLDKRTGKRKPSGTYVYSPNKINEWLLSKGLPVISRETVYKHRVHVMHPNDKLISAVQKHEMERGVQPQQVSEDEFLDSLITIGQRKIAADPESVTIDQALKAVQIKKGGNKLGSGINVLVGIMTGGPTQPTVIEGEVHEIGEAPSS